MREFVGNNVLADRILYGGCIRCKDGKIVEIKESLLRHGVTTAQCTTVSAPIEQLKEFFAFFRKWKRNPEMAKVHGKLYAGICGRRCSNC